MVIILLVKEFKFRNLGHLLRWICLTVPNLEIISLPTLTEKCCFSMCVRLEPCLNSHFKDVFEQYVNFKDIIFHEIYMVFNFFVTIRKKLARLVYPPVSQPWWLNDLSPGWHLFAPGWPRSDQMKNSDQNEDVVLPHEDLYVTSWRPSWWVGMIKCSQDLLIFKFSHRVLVLLVGRLFFRPGSFKNPPGGFRRAVTQGWLYQFACQNSDQFLLYCHVQD